MKMLLKFILCLALILFSAHSTADTKAELKRTTCSKVEEFSSLLPEPYVVDEYWEARDFDGDGKKDYMVAIRDTDRAKFEEIEDFDTLVVVDRNPRGYLLMMNKGNHFEATAYNFTCFPSENEDGGVYFAPELYIYYDDESRILVVDYNHGRYGGWGYRFRYKDGDFVLIGSSKGESMSYITEILYSEDIDYEKGVAKYRRLVNEQEFMDWEEGDEYPEPKYEECERKIGDKRLEFVRMSSQDKWD